MSLLLFLHRVKKAATDDDRDDGCVREKSSCMPSKVDEARHLVYLVEERGKKRGGYLKLTLKEKATIGKYASENGVASAVKKFKTKNLKESSIRDWQDAYLKEFKNKLKGRETCKKSFSNSCIKWIIEW